MKRAGGKSDIRVLIDVQVKKISNKDYILHK